MKIHENRSPLAGVTVRIKADAKHHLYSDFAGAEFEVIDWADRVYKRSVYGWAYCPIEVRSYCARWARFLIGSLAYGQDDEVLVGRVMGNLEIVHISEIEAVA